MRLPPLDRRLQAGLALLLVVFSFHGVFGRSLWGPNDTREGGMIWDMYRHGTWVTPTIDGRPFLEKPPLLHWTALVLCNLTGRVTEGLVRLPAALFGFGTLVLVYAFVAGARRPGEGGVPDGGRQLAGWAAAFLCGTAIEFQEYSRVVLTDMALTFMVTLSLYLFWRAARRPAPKRWAAFLVAAAAAFYAKGLVGPLLIWSGVGLYLVWRRRFRLLAALAAAYVPLLVLVVVPWVIGLYRFAGAPALRFFFWDNQVGRFFHFRNVSLPHDPFFINKEPLYYYLLNLPLYVAPWTLLIPPAIVGWARRASPFREPLHLYVAGALSGMFLLLEVSSAKVVNYALPLYPFLFIMVGIWLVDLGLRPRPGVIDGWLVRLTAWGVALLCAGVPVTYVVVLFVRPELAQGGGTAGTVAGFVLAAVIFVLVVAAGLLLRTVARSCGRALAFGLAPAAYALAAIGILQLVTPPIDRVRSYRPIASLAADYAHQGRAVALATGQEKDVGAFTFYLDRRLPVLNGKGDVASFLAAPEPRAVIAPLSSLSEMAPLLAGIRHQDLVTGAPDTLSRSFVLLINRPGEDLGVATLSGPRGGRSSQAEGGMPRGRDPRTGGRGDQARSDPPMRGDLPRALTSGASPASRWLPRGPVGPPR